MTIVIMALVDKNGNVVNKIVVDTTKPFIPPAGLSMHEWDERVDGPAYARYLVSRQPAKKAGRGEKAAQWVKGHLRRLKTYVSTRVKLKSHLR